MDNGSEWDWSEENAGVRETGRRFPEELVPGLLWDWVQEMGRKFSEELVPGLLGDWVFQTPTRHWLLHRLGLYWPRQHVMVAGWNWPVAPPPAPNVTLHYRPQPGLNEGQGVGAQGALQQLQRHLLVLLTCTVEFNPPNSEVNLYIVLDRNENDFGVGEEGVNVLQQPLLALLNCQIRVNPEVNIYLEADHNGLGAGAGAGGDGDGDGDGGDGDGNEACGGGGGVNVQPKADIMFEPPVNLFIEGDHNGNSGEQDPDVQQPLSEHKPQGHDLVLLHCAIDINPTNADIGGKDASE